MGVAETLRWMFPSVTRYWNEKFPGYPAEWERLDATTRVCLQEVEERAHKRASWTSIVYARAVPNIVEERETYRRSYGEFADTMKEWATSPYDPVLNGMQWGTDKDSKDPLTNAPLPGKWFAHHPRVGAPSK